MKAFLKRMVPEWIFSCYYWCFSIFGAIFFRFPSEKMIIIGVTGTKGKTSTANFIWSCAKVAGIKAGIITTANIRIGDDESLNYYHMTMPGRFAVQRTLARMVKVGCKICVVETTSEGLKQWRHAGINYDIAIFTNLTPEHLPSHGGDFEKYKQAKGRLFQSIGNSKRKILDGKKVEKVIVANGASEHSKYFLAFQADKKITFGVDVPADITARNVKETGHGVTFSVDGKNYQISLLGGFNVANALPAMAVMRLLGVRPEKVAEGLKQLTLIPGRMEMIEGKQAFMVIVDYAHEGQSMNALLETSRRMIAPGRKIIVLFGAEGGGRDKAKRPAMAEIAAKKADYVIVSDVDPYDDDPIEICEDIARCAEKFGKIRGKDLFVIGDRRTGIAQALRLAHGGDIVLIAGKGAEQSMIVKGGIALDWDDRRVVREELQKITS